MFAPPLAASCRRVLIANIEQAIEGGILAIGNVPNFENLVRACSLRKGSLNVVSFIALGSVLNHPWLRSPFYGGRGFFVHRVVVNPWYGLKLWLDALLVVLL